MQDVRCGTEKVFSIPELVGLVSEFVEPGDIVRLSRVCQHTFTVLVPTVWQRVNANHLLPLIKATTVREPEECTPIGPVQEIVCACRHFISCAPFAHDYIPDTRRGNRRY